MKEICCKGQADDQVNAWYYSQKVQMGDIKESLERSDRLNETLGRCLCPDGLKAGCLLHIL